MKGQNQGIAEDHDIYSSIVDSLEAHYYALPKLFRLSDAGLPPRDAGDDVAMQAVTERGIKIKETLLPNSIIQGTIAGIQRSSEPESGAKRSSGEIKSLKIRLDSFVALAHSGQHLYEPYSEHKYLYGEKLKPQQAKGLDAYPIDQNKFGQLAAKIVEHQQTLFPETSKSYLQDQEPALIGTIKDSKHIYDSKMPHIALEIDKAELGSQVLVMVRDVQPINEHANMHRMQPVHITLTLLNSRLQGCKQISLDGSKSFSLLGLKKGKKLIQLDTAINRMDQLGISSYAYVPTLGFSEAQDTEDCPIKQSVDHQSQLLQSIEQFDYQKLREAQNLQWSEELLQLGIELESQAKLLTDLQQRRICFKSALEHYSAAINFDRFNNQVWECKIKLLMRLKQFKECEETIKACLKLQNDSASDSLDEADFQDSGPISEDNSLQSNKFREELYQMLMDVKLKAQIDPTESKK